MPDSLLDTGFRRYDEQGAGQPLFADSGDDQIEGVEEILTLGR
jgi:hypothetical protein